MAKKGIFIVLSSTDSSISRHFFISKNNLYITIFILTILFFLILFGAIKYTALSYRLIELEILKKRNAEIEKEFSKLKAIKKKLELAEAENQKIKIMLGIDKSPNPVMPSTENTEDNYKKELINSETIGNLPSLLPATGRISRKFSCEHPGIDIAGPLFTPVIASANGRVHSIGWDTLYGNYVVIEHSQNYKTFYGHLHSILVNSKVAVKAGEIIGTLGSTGKSTSPHLHYEVIFQGQPVDPMTYLPSTIKNKGGL